jgi:hypothetical protein
MSPIPTPASHGTEAIYAAGLAVNKRRLDSTDAIRRAIPVARQAAVAVKSRSESTGWQVGQFTGLSIAIYQNWLYEVNREWHFTDGTLCVLWCIEFPDARSDYPARWHYIASTRREYNTGRHQAPAPAIPCVGYDESGNPASRTGQSANPFSGVQTAASPSRSLQTGLTHRFRRPPEQPYAPVLSHAPSPIKFDFSSDPAVTAARVAALDAYMERHVLGSRGFSCVQFRECRSSHSGTFFEGQLHHVGGHYDLTLNGRPFRIAVVGQEYGNGPTGVTRTKRSHDVSQR